MLPSGLTGRLLIALSLLFGCYSCSRAATPVARAGDSWFGIEKDVVWTQSLFRMRYKGPRGAGTLRMVLRTGEDRQYAIETKDRFGRSLWRLLSTPTATRLIDDRRRVTCESSGDVRIPEIALESLPLRELPPILFGRLPSDLVPTQTEGEFLDASGRRWTVTEGNGEVRSWTVWEDDKPWLWWSAMEEDVGLLSHRAGSQLRWRLVASEPIKEDERLWPPAAFEVGDDYAAVSCQEWVIS